MSSTYFGPWRSFVNERTTCTTYFLRDVLHSSQPTFALFLGIGKVNVDELDRFAEKRMEIPVENPRQSRVPHSRPTHTACPAHSMAFTAFE